MPLGISPWSCLASVVHSAETCPISNTRLFQPYTGNFAYCVQPILSEHTFQTILGRLSYPANSKSEFSLVQGINEKDTKQMVFEIFLVRVELEAVLEPQTGRCSGQAE